MSVEFLTEIERLLHELGSAVAGKQKERITSLQKQLSAHQICFAQLSAASGVLTSGAAAAGHGAPRPEDDFVVGKGAFFRRLPAGGYSNTVYCPTCHRATQPFPPRGQFSCGCGWQSSFGVSDLPGVVRQLPSS